MDEISSCEDILRGEFFRVFIWIMVALTVVGNSGVLVYRLLIDRKGSGLGYSTFITSLSASDLLMGVYLATVGGADFAYRGRYLWEAEQWKSSSYCSLAGFLCLVSSEVSALTICLVTLDRFLALAFPLSHFHFSKKSARVAVAASWAIGAVMATVPLLPPLSHWRFYSQNGVCIPLPITRARFPGSDYSFGIFIVFNFIVFISIAVGQMLVFGAVKKNSMKNTGGIAAHRRKNDQAIARKLALVAVTDFLCWFPIGIMGLLSRFDVPVPGQANVITTIFILPLNSALNPWLYTLTAIRQTLKDNKRQKKARPAKSGSSSTNPSTQSTDAKRRGKGGKKSVAPSPAQCIKKLEEWLASGKISASVVRTILKNVHAK